MMRVSGVGVRNRPRIHSRQSYGNASESWDRCSGAARRPFGSDDAASIAKADAGLLRSARRTRNEPFMRVYCLALSD